MSDENTMREQRSRIEKALEDDSGVVTGWVVVWETAGPDGARFLHRIESDPCTEWQREGYLHNALYSGSWLRDDTEDES